MWPDSIVISEWFFKQPTVTAGHKQQRSGESTREQPSHPIDPTGAAAAATDDVTVDMTSDDTILAVCNMDTASSSNDGF